MLFSGILSAGLLPLVSCMSHGGSASSKARSVITPRMTLSGDDLETQFQFAPLEFKEICLDCSRGNATAQYSCSTKCPSPLNLAAEADANEVSSSPMARSQFRCGE